MVTGSGLIAKAFSEYQPDTNILIFASGVSDSKSGIQNNFEREKNLLTQSIAENKTKKFVYFGTSSVDDPDLKQSLYVQHKLNMESLIQRSNIDYIIFRLPNLAGFTENPGTILNFLYNRIANNEAFDLWKNSERNVIDVSDVYKTVDYILRNNLFINRVINIANTKNYPVDYIVHCIEGFCNKKSIYREIEKGVKFDIDLSDVLPVYKQLNIQFDDDYLQRILEKYYSGNDL